MEDLKLNMPLSDDIEAVEAIEAIAKHYTPTELIAVWKDKYCDDFDENTIEEIKDILDA